MLSGNLRKRDHWGHPDADGRIIYIHVVRPCHRGMARPQVADRGTASHKEGSCEYIEYAVVDSR